MRKDVSNAIRVYFHKTIICFIIAIYTKTNLHIGETTMTTEFHEDLWLIIKLKEGDQLLIGCIYRSPNSNRPNNASLRKLLEEAADKGSTHMIILGDFNYPEIDWCRWTTPGDDVNEMMVF